MIGTANAMRISRMAIVGFSILAPLFEAVALAITDSIAPWEVVTCATGDLIELRVVSVAAVVAAPWKAAVVVAAALAGLFITFPTDEQKPLKLFQLSKFC